MIIVGITGTHGAGKGAVVEYLVSQYGFRHFSARDFLTKEVDKRGLPVNRDSMHIVANDLRKTHHAGYIADQLYEMAVAENKSAIIESIRTVGEIEVLKARGNFYLFALDAEPRTRYERIKKRKSATDDVSFEKFIEDEKKEIASDDPTQQNIRACIEQADFVFQNDGTLVDMQRKITDVMKKLLTK